ncbi:hypothetical protein CGLO_02243 [Colletotrichum gloeosporioides Cg-14]|uniref:Uncharacterized protein n=1 Tax=Colletotrichum gloeosporioides (strain Cg-14) TaxID=1237896 RepID=T0KYK6_COLGC|nr:hypothetical protein CGLO_02243 [Colletotrichum gloeosporioides Cg-14]
MLYAISGQSHTDGQFGDDFLLTVQSKDVFKFGERTDASRSRKASARSSNNETVKSGDISRWPDV